MNGTVVAPSLVPDDPAPPVVAALPVRGGGAPPAPPDGVDHLLLCDGSATVDLDLAAVQALLDVARATGAGIVGPKLVDADDRRRLVGMGYAVTRGGAVAHLVEPGELDQGQHDGTRDVFAVPGECLLVRADLLRSVGFDPALSAGRPAAVVSLCWRARTAGAAVVVTSDAVAAVRRPDTVRPTDLVTPTEQVRLVVTCYGLGHRWRVVPQVVAAQVWGAARALVRARPAAAVAPVGAWAVNLARVRSRWAVRGRVRRARRTPDRTVRRRQAPGVLQARLAARRDLPGAVVGVPRPVVAWAHRLRNRWSNEGAVVMLALAGVLAVGSRHLVTRGVPEVGELLPLGTGNGLLRLALTVGLVPVGVAGAVVAARAATGSVRAPVAAAVAYAALPMPYAALDAGRWAPLAVYAAAPWWLRLLTPDPRPRSAADDERRAVAATIDAVDVAQVADDDADDADRAAGSAVAGEDGGADRPARRFPRPAWLPRRRRDRARVPRHRAPRRRPAGIASRGWRVAVAGALTAAVAAVVPSAPALLAGAGIALAVGALLAFRPREVLTPLVVGTGGALAAVVLHLPWALDPDSTSSPWSALQRLAEGDGAPVAGPPTPVDLLGFAAGRPDVLPWLWALPVAAAVPLLVGRADRLTGAIRAWTVALAGWVAALVAGRVGAEAPLPDVDVLLVLAGAGVAAAVGLGAAALEVDVAPPRRKVRRRDRRRWRPPTRARRLGRRSILGGLAVVAVALASVPLLRSAVDGYWGMPRGDFHGVLGFVEDEVARTGGTILWLGDTRVLPLRHDVGARRADLGRGMGPRRDPIAPAMPGAPGEGALALTDRLPRVVDRWRPAPEALVQRVRASVEAGTSELTHRLGGHLAALGVAYVVVPQGLAPAPFGPPEAPSPGVVDALDGQFDLQRVAVDPSVLVYRNLAFAGRHAGAAAGAAAGERVDPPDSSAPQPGPTFPAPASRRPAPPGRVLDDGERGDPSPWKLRVGLTAWGAVLLYLLVHQRRKANLEGADAS